MRRLIFVLLCACASTWAQDAPKWAHDAAAAQAPAYPDKVNEVVLLHEQHVTVEPDGRRITEERGAIRVLRPNRGTVGAAAYYNQRDSKVRDFHAWLLVPGARDNALKSDRFADGAASTNETYNDRRFRSISVNTDTLTAGTVFVWSYTLEERGVFTYDSFYFQTPSPTLIGRYTLTLPSGWRSDAVVLNHAPIEPRVNGNESTWELTNLPWVEYEVHHISTPRFFPWLGVRYYPPAGTNPGLPVLENWTAVSRWLSSLAEPAAAVTPALSAKANDLTAGATSELDKLARIAAWTQKVNYVSVQMNLQRGGGFTPHSADFVLNRNYGDCKDKATLMRALLKAAGIDSYLVVISADDRDHVREEWPAPQFNHAIIAVRVAAATQLPTVLDHPRLGRLAFFDPTDELTPLGELPISEQGSPALVLAGDKGELVHAPLLDPSTDRIESTVEAELGTNGVLKSTLTRRYSGQSARYTRSLVVLDGEEKTRKHYEHMLSQRIGESTLRSVKPTDHLAEHRIDVAVEFEAPRFAQIQGKLVLLKPGALAAASSYSFPAKPRQMPVRLFADDYVDTVNLTVPAGLAVDELPDPIKLETPYGSFIASYTSKDNRITYQQKFTVRDAVVPAADYAKLRDFFERVAGYQQSVAVLVSK